MTSITTNAARLAAEYRRRRERLAGAIRQGLTDVAKAVDRAQVGNLTGAGDPGAYPVPVRTGNLRASHFFEVRGHRFAIVGNTAAYAIPVHDGVPARGTEGRPFLDDAVRGTDVLTLMAIRVERALGLRGAA